MITVRALLKGRA